MKAARPSATHCFTSASVSVGALLELHGGLDLLAQLRVGHAVDGGVGDLGVVHEPLLDLDAVDVLAAPDDHVLLAVGDEEEAVLVEVADVAGVQPAVGVDGLGGGLGLVPVAGHEDRAGDADLAGLADAERRCRRSSTIFTDTVGTGGPTEVGLSMASWPEITVATDDVSVRP